MQKQQLYSITFYNKNMALIIKRLCILADCSFLTGCATCEAGDDGVTKCLTCTTMSEKVSRAGGCVGR